MFIPSLLALIPHSSHCPASLQTAAAMLGYINLQPDCAAQCLMSESRHIFRETRRRKGGHHRLSVQLRNQIQAIKF